MGRVLRFVHDVRRANTRRRILLLEALVCLPVARLVIRHIPFQRLAKWLSRQVVGPELDEPARTDVLQDVRWSVHRAACLFALPPKCFPRAVVAQFMLRRRRVGTCLYYGTAIMPGKGLTAHVWLKDGNRGITGHRVAESYHVLARYSSSRQMCESIPTIT